MYQDLIKQDKDHMHWLWLQQENYVNKYSMKLKSSEEMLGFHQLQYMVEHAKELKLVIYQEEKILLLLLQDDY